MNFEDNWGSISDLAELNPESTTSEWIGREIHYIDIASVGEGYLKSEPEVILYDDAPSRARRVVRHGDLLISTVRPNRRSMIQIFNPVENTVASTGFALLRPKRIEDSDYLFGVISNKQFTTELEMLAYGAAYPAVSAKDICRPLVYIPPEHERDKVSKFLNPFTILSQSNLPRVIDEFLTAIFRSWFIDYDPIKAKINGTLPAGMDWKTLALFPDTFEDTIIGPVPSGWRLSNFEEVADLITDGAHESPPSISGGGVPMASVKDMRENQIFLNECRLISTEDADRLEGLNCVPRNGDLLIAKDGSILKHIFVFDQPERVVLLSSIAMIRFKKSFCPYFAKYYLESPGIRHFFIGGYTGGSAIPRFVLNEFKKFPVPVPPPEIIARFSRIAKNLHSLGNSATNQIQALFSLRNELLPMLMIGKLNLNQGD